MSFLAYNGSSQKEVAPNVGHNYLEVRWTTVYEYWINSNLDDLYKICDKAFLIGSCMSVSLSLQHTHTHTHTHTQIFIHGFYVVWARGKNFQGKERTSGK